MGNRWPPRGATRVIYAVVRQVVKDRLDELAGATGLPLSTLTDLLLARALGIEDWDPRARIVGNLLEGKPSEDLDS